VATVNLIRVRPACTSTPSTLELIKKDQRRSSRFPLPQGPQQQLLDVVNASFRVRAGEGGGCLLRVLLQFAQCFGLVSLHMY
jgi:hypothetical protein